VTRGVALTLATGGWLVYADKPDGTQSFHSRIEVTPQSATGEHQARQPVSFSWGRRLACLAAEPACTTKVLSCSQVFQRFDWNRHVISASPFLGSTTAARRSVLRKGTLLPSQAPVDYRHGK